MARTSAAHQPAGFDNLASGIGRGNPKLRRERRDLAALADDRRCWSCGGTSSAKGAFGRHERQDRAGMRLATAASGCRSSIRRSMELMVRHAGQRTQSHQWWDAIRAPMVGENNMGIPRAWRSFQAATSRSASSNTWPSIARLAPTAASAMAFRSASILRRLNPMSRSSPEWL